MVMQCAEAQTLLSAAMDGDLVPSDELEAHVAGCRTCREWRNRAHALTRLGVEPAPRGLTRRVAATLPEGFTRYRWVRLALAWGGLLLLVWHLPGMVDSGSDVVIRHLSRHQHAFGFALGVVFLFVAWRPDRAYGVVPMAAAFTVTLAGAALVDLIMGASTLEREAPHVVELVGLALVWTLGVSAGPGRRWGSRSGAARRPAGDSPAPRRAVEPEGNR